jgi:hypothetical protein
MLSSSSNGGIHSARLQIDPVFSSNLKPHARLVYYSLLHVFNQENAVFFIDFAKPTLK